MTIPVSEIIELLIGCAKPAFAIALVFGLGTFIFKWFLKMALGGKTKL